jgi:hypothetical protein
MEGIQLACGVRRPLKNLPLLRELFNINRNLRNFRLSVASSSSPDIRNFKWPVTYEYSTGTSHTRHIRSFRHSRCASPHRYLRVEIRFDFVRPSTLYSHKSPFFAKVNGSIRGSIISLCFLSSVLRVRQITICALTQRTSDIFTLTFIIKKGRK